MERRHFFMAIIVLVFLFVPMLAQAHLLVWEGEVFRKYGEPVSDEVWQQKVEWIFGADPMLGGEDYSFDLPFIIPEGEINLGRAAHIHLHKDDVDVFKYTAAEGEEFCFIMYSLVPGCFQYRNFYPVVGILGPGVPDRDVFPFEKPADCQDCGFMSTNPTKGRRWTDRPVTTGPEESFPLSHLFYVMDWETDAIGYEGRVEGGDGTDLHFKGPGTFYIVAYEPDGKPGDASVLFGFEECAEFYNPGDIFMMKWHQYMADDDKTASVRCIALEGWDWADLPARYPIPGPCNPSQDCEVNIMTLKNQ